MNARNANRAIERAQQALAAGRAEAAYTHARTALDLAGPNPRALAALARALTRLGRPAEAQNHLAAGLKAAPGEPALRIALGEWLLAQNRAAEAERELSALLQRAPAESEAWELLGDAAAAQGRAAPAREAYSRALAAHPGDPALTLKLARVTAALGDLAGARVLLDSIRGGDSEALHQLKAELLVVARDWPALRALAESWRKLRPNSVAALRMQAAAAFELGDFRSAQEATKKMLELGTPGAADWAAYGQISLQVNDFAAAETAFAEAAKTEPNQPELLAGQARLFTFQGRLDDAETACRAALAADPNRADSFWLLALLTKGRFTPAELDTLKRLSRQNTLTPDNRAMAALALAHGLEAAGDIAAACAAYDEAHAGKLQTAAREGYVYDAARSEARFARIAALFAENPVPAAATKPGAVRPIFVLGMPRSGTTLTDAVLAGHPLVQDCSERVTMEWRLNDLLRRAERGEAPPSAATLQDWARSYLGEIALRPGAAYIVDKNPLNFQAVGLIAQLFPDAVMIHTRRNPLEVGLSVWRHEFTKGWTFANRLADIGHFYGQYARLMAHWQRVLGARLITIQYEDFAADFARRAPALLAQIGLEWDEACGDFSRPRPPIATLTAVQVRDVVKPASPRAPKFGAYLEPLRQALIAADVDLETGAWRGA